MNTFKNKIVILIFLSVIMLSSISCIMDKLIPHINPVDPVSIARCSDEYEDNNSILNAYPIADIPWYGESINATIYPSADEDYYKIYSGIYDIEISLSNIPSEKNYNVYLYDYLGNEVEKSERTGNGDEFIGYDVSYSYPGAFHYVKVATVSGYSCSSYLLEVNW